MFKKNPPKFEITSETFDRFIAPLTKILTHTPELLSRGDRPLKMIFEDQLKALVYFHLQEHKSARHLVLDMKENDFAKQNIAPEGGISRSSFSEAINHRGLDQLQYIFKNLYKQASKSLPREHKNLGDLISIDGSLINAVLSMYWADYLRASITRRSNNRRIRRKRIGGSHPFCT
nr:hypothetical protein [uncultured Desulfobacter sp.]